MSQPTRFRAIGLLASTAALAALLAGSHVSAADPISTMSHTQTGAYLSGTIAATRSDLSAAAAFMREVLENDPGNNAVLSEALRLSLAGNGVEDALPLARDAAEQMPENGLASVLLIVEAMARGEFAEAQAIMDGLERSGVTRFSLPFVEAWALAGQGDLVSADAALDQVRDTGGFGSLAHLHLALMFDLEDRVAEAENEYYLALEGARTDLLLQAIASLLSRDDRADEAIDLLTGEIESGNESVLLAAALAALQDGQTIPRPVPEPGTGLGEAFYQIANALTQEGAIIPSLNYTRFAQFLWPNTPQIQLLLADVLRNAEANEDALSAYAEIEMGTRHGNLAALRRASLLVQLERYEQALTQLSELAEITPDSAQPHIQRGDLLRIQQRYAEAVEAYDVAVERLPRLVDVDWSFLYRRGIALERAGDWARAESDLIQAIDINPDSGHLLNYLGYSWADRGINVDEAEELLLRAIELEPEDGFIADSVGWVYYRTGRLGEAIEWLELAITLEPTDPEINDHLGDAYWVDGRRTEAVFQWRRALSNATDLLRIEDLENKLQNGLSESGILEEYRLLTTAN